MRIVTTANAELQTPFDERWTRPSSASESGFQFAKVVLAQFREDLLHDGSGHLLGTATIGGMWGEGLAFELTRTANGWRQTVVRTFGARGDYGGQPVSGLAAMGNHY